MFEKRRGNAAISGTMAVLGAGLTVYGGYHLLATWQNDIAAASLALVPGSLLLLFGLWAFVNRIRLYENGVEQRSFLGTRFLAHADVQVLQYAASRILVAGIPAGTRIWVTLRPARGRPVVFDLTTRGQPAELERLRDHVASLIAARWLDDIQRGGEVAWGSSLLLTAEGLRYRPARLLGRGPDTLLPYSEPFRWAIAEGHLAIARNGQAVATLACGAPNFYPGLLCLHRLTGATSPA